MLPINIGYGTTSTNTVQTVTPRLQNEVLVTENGVLNISNYNFDSRLESSSGSAMPEIFSQAEKIEIERHLIDDTYNIKIFRTFKKSTSDIEEYASIGVNNVQSIGGPRSAISDQLINMDINPNSGWIINHDLFNNIKFRDTTILGVGSDIYRNNITKPIFKYVISPFYETLPTNVDLDFDQILHIPVLKKITLSQKDFQNHGHVHVSTVGDSHGQAIRTDNNDFNVTLDYNHLYIKPEPLDRYHGNETIAKIYIKNDGGIDSTFDHNITKGTMKSTGLGNTTAQIYFQNTENKNVVLENTGAHLLGSIKSLDSLYYDYSDHTVKIGSTSDSIYGDIVPLNFHGEYTREINIPLNAVFKELNIRFHTNVETAVLDPSEGEVSLQTKNDRSSLPEEDMPSKYFDIEDLKVIRDHSPSLRGLEGMLNE